MKIALQSFGVGYVSQGDSPTAKGERITMLKRVKQCGYEGIEMGTPPGFTPQEFKDFMDDLGLQIVSAGGINLNATDFDAKLEEFRILGVKNTMIGYTPEITLGNPYELGKFIDNLNRVGKILMEGGGVHLSYHNHAIDFAKVYGKDGKTVMETIMDETDPAYVFFEPDTFWIQAGGGHVITWLKKLKGRMYTVHFKDYGIDQYSDHTFLEGTHQIFTEIGNGNLNWPGIIEEVRNQGIEWVVVEQDRMQRPSYESIKISCDNLRKFLA